MQTGDLSEAKKAVAEIDKYVAQFMSVAGQVMQELQAALTEIKARPRIKSVRMERANGQPPRAVPEYDDDDEGNSGGGSPAPA